MLCTGKFCKNHDKDAPDATQQNLIYGVIEKLVTAHEISPTA